MPYLNLNDLHCKATEDWTGADEIYILVNGERIWGPQSINDGDSVRIGKGKPFSGKRVKVELYDQDAGAGDDDDHLGTRYASSKLGSFEMSFTGDDAEYTLYAEVTK